MVVDEQSKTKFINIWRGEGIERLAITPERRRIVFNHNLLIQFLYLDNGPLFIALKTAKQELNFQGLVSELRNSGYLRKGEDPEEMVSLALDTLLDCAIFKPIWESTSGIYERRFVNRNELIDRFHGFEKKLMLKLKDTNFSKDLDMLRRKIYLTESQDASDELYFEERKNRIENELIKFIKERIIRPDKYDVLIPIVRKGRALLDHLEKKHMIEIESIGVEYNIDSKRLNGKRILIFDDATDRGRTIWRVLKRLEGIPKENIFVASFLVNATHFKGRLKKKIVEKINQEVEFYKQLEDLQFDEEVSNIMMYIASFGSIIDPDHLVIDAEFDEPIESKIVMKILKNMKMGNVLEPDLQHLHPDKKKITLDKIDFQGITGDNLPETVNSIDQCKIRTVFEFDNNLLTTQRFTVVPIINPKINAKVEGNRCETLPSFRFCCEISKQKETEEEYERLCVDCTVFHMVTRLVEKFLESFHEKLPNKKLYIRDVRWTGLEEKYNSFFKDEFVRFKYNIVSKYR